MARISPEKAVENVEKFSILFGVPMPNVEFDRQECFSRKGVVACFIIEENMISFMSDFIDDKWVAHEIGHYIWHYYNPNRNCDPDVCESFAHYFEVLWLATGFSFKCEVCGSAYPINMLDSGEVQCARCGSIYGLRFW